MRAVFQSGSNLYIPPTTNPVYGVVLNMNAQDPTPHYVVQGLFFTQADALSFLNQCPQGTVEGMGTLGVTPVFNCSLGAISCLGMAGAVVDAESGALKGIFLTQQQAINWAQLMSKSGVFARHGAQAVFQAGSSLYPLPSSNPVYGVVLNVGGMNITQGIFFTQNDALSLLNQCPQGTVEGMGSILQPYPTFSCTLGSLDCSGMKGGVIDAESGVLKGILLTLQQAINWAALMAKSGTFTTA